MFNKTFLFALILCVCYFGVISARPEVPDMPIITTLVKDSLVPKNDALPLGAVTGAVNGGLGSLTSGLPGVPLGSGGK